MGFRNAFNGIPPSSITGDMLANGTIAGSKLQADAIDGMTITGAHIRTAATGLRWEMDSVHANELRGYTGDTAELAPGALRIFRQDPTAPWEKGYSQVTLTPPTVGVTGSAPTLWLVAPDQPTSPAAGDDWITLGASTVYLVGGNSDNEDGYVEVGEAGTKLGTAGTYFQRGIRFGGPTSLTFNGSGEATLTHGLTGTVPLFVGLSHDAGGTIISLAPKAGTVGTAGTVVVQARKNDGTAYVGALSAVRWVVIG